jgi:hypothetical protein
MLNEWEKYLIASVDRIVSGTKKTEFSIPNNKRAR